MGAVCGWRVGAAVIGAAVVGLGLGTGVGLVVVGAAFIYLFVVEEDRL